VDRAKPQLGSNCEPNSEKYDHSGIIRIQLLNELA